MINNDSLKQFSIKKRKWFSPIRVCLVEINYYIQDIIHLNYLLRKVFFQIQEANFKQIIMLNKKTRLKRKRVSNN